MKNYYTFLMFISFIYSNVSAQWFQQNSSTSVNLKSVFFIDENTGWVCGDSGKILKTTNRGLNWFEQNSNITDPLTGIQFVDADFGWAYGPNQILQTTDGGFSWDLLTVPASSSITALQFINANTGWMIYQLSGNISAIGKTTNSGNNWTIQSQSTDEYNEAIFFLNENYGWVTTFPGGILKTTNGGSDWLFHNENFSGAPMCVRFVDQLTGWVSHNTLGSFEISKSTDGGESWFSQISESFKYIISISFPGSNIGYAAGYQMSSPPNPYEGFILKTPNGGADWTEQYNGAGELNFIFFLNDTLGWAAGDEGKILATENGGVTSVRQEKFNPFEFNLSQNYPNPFNPTTKIKYQIPNESFVSLNIFDVLGNEVATLINEEKPAGEYEVEFDVGTSRDLSLSSGIYFYQLKASSFIQTKKMILLK